MQLIHFNCLVLHSICVCFSEHIEQCNSELHWLLRWLKPKHSKHRIIETNFSALQQLKSIKTFSWEIIDWYISAASSKTACRSYSFLDLMKNLNSNFLIPGYYCTKVSMLGFCLTKYSTIWLSLSSLLIL